MSPISPYSNPDAERARRAGEPLPPPRYDHIQVRFKDDDSRTANCANGWTKIQAMWITPYGDVVGRW